MFHNKHKLFPQPKKPPHIRCMKKLATGLVLLFAMATNAGYASCVPENEKAKQSTQQVNTPTKQQVVLGNGKTYPTSKLQFTNASAQRLKDLPDSSELYPLSNPYNSYNHDFQGTYPPQQQPTK